MRRILIVDDRAEDFADFYRISFPDDRIALARSGQEGIEVLDGDEFWDVVILDVRMPAHFARVDEEEGLAVLDLLSADWPEIPVILLSVLTDVDTVVRGMRLGAFYYVRKPPDPERLRHLVDRAIEHRSAQETGRKLRESIDLRDHLTRPAKEEEPTDRLGAIVGGSRPMQQVFGLLRRVAPTAATVLVLGESGTGKELVAKEIHRLSDRAAGPLTVVNCPALPRELLESELFGHRKGSFTGATEDRKGAFERADGGTLFLDEMGEMSLDLQAKLLRALEQGEVHAIGAAEPRRVNVRIIAATNRDLRGEVAAGRFREDLYYRLNVIRVVLPPLRERTEDIPALATELLGKMGGAELAPDARRALEAHTWPGNVRELRNVLERAAMLCAENEIAAEQIDIEAEPAAKEQSPAATAFQAALDGDPYEGTLVDFRNAHGEVALKELLERAIRWTADIQRAGRMLGFIRSESDRRDYDNLRQWMRKLGVSKRSVLKGG